MGEKVLPTLTDGDLLLLTLVLSLRDVSDRDRDRSEGLGEELLLEFKLVFFDRLVLTV